MTQSPERTCSRSRRSGVLGLYAKRSTSGRSVHSVAVTVVTVLVLTSAAWSFAASSCPSGPQYSNTRYDDDFSYLRNPVCSKDFWDPLKYISLSSRRDWYLSLG